MRGAPRRRLDGGWSRVLALLCLVALLATGCSNPVPGQPAAAAIPRLTAAESIVQSLVNLGEAGAVHYTGSLTTASDEKLAFDITVSMVGEVLGTIVVDGATANVLVINKTLYLKAPAAFWSSLSGLGGGEGKGTAIADRWVKLPSVLLGLEFGEIFTPDALSQHLLSDTGGEERALAEREKTTAAGLEVVRVTVGSGAAYLTARPPHGVAKVEQASLGATDNTRVSSLVAEVADTSAETAAFYRELAAQAAGLETAVDALTTVEQGAHRFESCGAQSCSLIVEFKNTAKVPVRVHIKADWTGDDAPLGTCEIQVGPIAPGQPGAATCTLNTPQWVSFWQRAHSVVGTHPYGASWAPLVLADAPDLSAVNTRASAKPADPADRKTDGSHFVYSISHAGTVWKYGVVGSRYWQDHAKSQLRTCLAASQMVCTVELVTATDNAASGYALQGQLIAGHRQASGACPTAQWVGCRR